MNIHDKRTIIAGYLAGQAEPLRGSNEVSDLERFCALESLCLAVQKLPDDDLDLAYLSERVEDGEFKTDPVIDRYLSLVSTNSWANGEIAELVNRLRFEEDPPVFKPLDA